MRLRTLRLLLLPILFVAVLALPPAFAQSAAEFKALFTWIEKELS